MERYRQQDTLYTIQNLVRGLSSPTPPPNGTEFSVSTCNDESCHIAEVRLIDALASWHKATARSWNA